MKASITESDIQQIIEKYCNQSSRWGQQNAAKEIFTLFSVQKEHYQELLAIASEQVPKGAIPEISSIKMSCPICKEKWEEPVVNGIFGAGGSPHKCFQSRKRGPASAQIVS